MLLFLDVDGVLNDLTIHAPPIERVIWNDEPLHLSEHICPDKIERLRYIVDKTKAQIVLSSHWRTDDFFKDCLADIFVYYKLHAWIAETPEANDAYPFLFGGRMPRFSQDAARAIEIKAWLMQNNNPTDYVVIDDRDVMYGHATGFEHLFSDVKDHFYQTHKCGLRDRDIEKIVELASRWA